MSNKSFEQRLEDLEEQLARLTQGPADCETCLEGARCVLGALAHLREVERARHESWGYRRISPLDSAHSMLVAALRVLTGGDRAKIYESVHTAASMEPWFAALNSGDRRRTEICRYFEEEVNDGR